MSLVITKELVIWININRNRIMDRKIEPKKGFSLVLSKKAMPYWLGALVVVFVIYLLRGMTCVRFVSMRIRCLSVK